MSEKSSHVSRMRDRVDEFSDEDESYAWVENRSLKFGLDEVENLCDELDLSEQVENFASTIYEQCHEKELVQGRSVEAVASASIYIACRVQNVPRSIEEISTKSRISKNKITRVYKQITKELEYELAPVDPKNFLEHIADNLQFVNDDAREHVVGVADEILTRIEGENIVSGRSPPGVAAGSIYLAARETGNNMTQGEVAEAAEVSEVTVRLRYKEQSEVWNSDN